MKKVAILFIVLLTSSFLFAQNTYVPDDKFEQALIDLGYDTTLDDYVLTANISGLTSLDVSNKEISDLTGIEAFTALTELVCSSNKLTSLDVSANTALTHLYCGPNELTSLDVSANTALTKLHCGDNKLTSLDVSKNTVLNDLWCGGNKLTSLDVSANTALTNLNPPNNQLTSLDVSSNTALTHLDPSNNQLTSLNVSSNTALTFLECSGNQLNSLDVSNNTALEVLHCDDNQLTSLDVSNNTALTQLHCRFNQLTTLDVSANTALTNLDCYDNQLTSLDVSANTALTGLHFGSNQLTSLNVSNNTALTFLDCSGNQLTSLNVSNNTALEVLHCYDNQLTSLDVSSHTALTELYCNDNQLTYLNMRNGLTAQYTEGSTTNNSLTCIEVLDPAWATANWISSNGNIDIDVGVTFAVICGGTDLTTWHVDTTGSDGSGSGTETSPLATIQTGINAATDGDTVLVAAGTYNENININKDIHVLGANRETTIIDGDQKGSVVIFNAQVNSFNNTVLAGFTLTNGNGTIGGDGHDGGGIEIDGGGKPTLRDLIIENNTAYHGGGIDLYNKASPNIENTIIRNNTAIYNTAYWSGEGGGIHAYGYTGTIKNVTISGNTAEKGGGLLVENSTLTIKNAIIANNHAINMSLSHSYSWGGGIWAASNNDITLTNVTISNNKAITAGGGIRTSPSSTLSVNNSIIWNNFKADGQDEIYGGDATVTYSNIKGGYTGTGNIDADPLFCDTLSYKYYDTSPAVGAGENGVNMGAGGIGCDVPQAFEWVSSALDTINITKTNLTDTYTAQWTESKDVYGDSIDYLISVGVGQFPAEMINKTADTSMTITYQDIIDKWYPNLEMLSRGTLKFSVSATDGIDTVNVTGDDRVLFVNRYEFLSTEGEGVPVEFALHENYPNPFNPTTTLRFDLPEVSNLTLTIYNMLGQKVRTFNMQSTPAGYHSITWDATNDYGEQVGAGVYLYQLQTKDFVKTRKMVLLK